MNALKRFHLFKQPRSILFRRKPSCIYNINHNSIQYVQSNSMHSRLFSKCNRLLIVNNTCFYENNNYNNLYYGIYRKFAIDPVQSSSDKKPSKKKKKSPLSTPKASDLPEGDREAEAKIQHIPSTGGELSTFVIIKEKTQETFSVIYIVGILIVCLPYTIYLVFSSLFSSSGSDKIRNETFDLIKEDSRILRILGNDIIAKQVSQNVNFKDDNGNERLQIIYQIQGGKGTGRVDVEMLKEDKDWRMQYCIVTSQYSVVTIVDNRALFVNNF